MQANKDQITQFEQDGFVIIDQILSPERVQLISTAMDRVYQGHYTLDRRPSALRKPIHPFGNPESVRWLLNSRVLDTDLWDLATDPEIAEMAATLLQTPSVSILEDQLLHKPAHGLPVNLHQDYSYWRFCESTQMITCWISLMDVTADLSPLQIVTGSHRWGIAPRPKELIVGSEDQWMTALESIIPTGIEPGFITVEVPAGGGVFFHSLTLHGSRRNQTDQPRRAISLHWAGESCRIDMAKTAEHNYPYFFARLKTGDRLVNKYMPIVFGSEI